MNKLLPVALVLATSSAAFANDTAPLNIKFSNFSDSEAQHCLYSTVLSSDQCSIQAIACSDNEEFVFNADLAKIGKHFDTITIKNEETQENVAQGAVVYAFGSSADNFSVTSKYGLENVNYYHTDTGVEFYLKPSESVVLFNEENYQGRQIEVVRSLPDLGEFNSDVDSYTIPEGWSLRFYNGKNYTGGYFTRGALRHGSYDGADFEPRVQSIRIIRTAEEIAAAREEDRR